MESNTLDDVEATGDMETILKDIPAEERFPLMVERQLDRLISAEPTGWSHPSQVLFRPRVPYESLLRACTARSEILTEEESSYRGRLEGVRGKLALAVRIEASARRRRKEMERTRWAS